MALCRIILQSYAMAAGIQANNPTEDGILYCLWGAAPVSDAAPWPMFQQSLDHNEPPIAYTNSVAYRGAPFVFNGFCTGHEFGFTGIPPSSDRLDAEVY